ncbi:hypothetical protein Avbf_00847 [Armadillidium vulgare]|nr:hypothetical protein Avbf_00847 [Armadillidium vulgare]
MKDKQIVGVVRKLPLPCAFRKNYQYVEAEPQPFHQLPNVSSLDINQVSKGKLTNLGILIQGT